MAPPPALPDVMRLMGGGGMRVLGSHVVLWALESKPPPPPPIAPHYYWHSWPHPFPPLSIIGLSLSPFLLLVTLFITHISCPFPSFHPTVQFAFLFSSDSFRTPYSFLALPPVYHSSSSSAFHLPSYTYFFSSFSLLPPHPHLPIVSLFPFLVLSLLPPSPTSSLPLTPLPHLPPPPLPWISLWGNINNTVKIDKCRHIMQSKGIWLDQGKWYQDWDVHWPKLGIRVFYLPS